MVDGSLENTTSVSMSSNFDEIGSYGVVDELVVFRDELVEAFLDDLTVSSRSLSRCDKLTWFPFKSFINATTFILNA